MRISDWSSDVCSSDLGEFGTVVGPIVAGAADVVFGSRFTSGGPHRVLYYWHYLGNRLLTTLSNAFTNLNLTDMETCYKAFRREVIQSLDLEEDRFGFEPEVTRSEEHTSELQSLMRISYAVFCLKKKKQ